MIALDIVIPTLNAAAGLPRTLASLEEAHAVFAVTLIGVDGGSQDQTLALLTAAGAQVVKAPRGRGIQMAAGVAAGRSAWLLILHADTCLSPGWSRVAAAFAGDETNRDKAGFARLCFDAQGRGPRLVAAIANWRAKALALPYGDQGLLLSRALYAAAGGFPPEPLMEDVALVRRLGRRRLCPLDITATTSAERYRREGWIRRPLRNITCQLLYRLGVSPARILTLYERKG